MIDFLQYCQWKLTLKAEILRLLLRAGAMIEARDHNGCTVMALDDIVFHETWCDYVREFVLVFCENNSIVNNNNNNKKKKKKKKNNNENSTEFSVLQILTALNFQLYIDIFFWFLRPWCLLLEQATLQVYRFCWISKPIQRWKTTRRLGTDIAIPHYPTKGERKLYLLSSTLGWDMV